jgi:hypothetical protein
VKTPKLAFIVDDQVKRGNNYTLLFLKQQLTSGVHHKKEGSGKKKNILMTKKTNVRHDFKYFWIPGVNQVK